MRLVKHIKGVILFVILCNGVVLVLQSEGRIFLAQQTGRNGRRKGGSMATKKTQIEFAEGMYELNQETLQELAGSKYMNEDLRPTTKEERTWTTYNVGMLWVGMVICITGFSFAAALIALGMNPILALLNVLIGNLIVLVPLQLNSHAGTRYGIPFPVLARVTFGTLGAHVPALLRAIVASGWCAVQCWVGGAAVSAFIGVFAKGWNVEGYGRFVGFAIFLIIILLMGLKGSEGIKVLESIGSPILLILCAGLVIWVIVTGNANGVSVGDMFTSPNNYDLLNENGGMAYVFMAGLTSNIAVWATLALNIPDFSRYAKSQSAQFKGQMYFMPTSVIVMAAIGAMFAKVTEVTTGTAQYDPTVVLTSLNNKFIVAVVAIATIIATLTTNMAANVVAPANGYANLAPTKINYKIGILITCIICVAFRPWWMYGSAGAFMFAWLGTCGTILGPVAAIMVADYFVVKKNRINVRACYDEKDNTYDYSSGWNWRALLAWALSLILPMMGMFGIGGAFTYWINANSYIIGFALAFVIYMLLMKSETKSQVSEEEFDAFTDKAF